MADEKVLSEILARWEDAYAAGQTLTPEELCTQHPHLLPQVRQQIQGLRAFDPLMRTTAQDRTPDSGTQPTLYREPGWAEPPAGGRPLCEVSRGLAGERFTILRPHAAGGLGQVSLGRDNRLGRHVAVKEIRPERRHDKHLQQRFVKEAEITGQLEHPGIVPIYGLEQDAAGQPYYVMRFIAGRTLAEAIKQFHSRGGDFAVALDFRSLAFRDLLKRFVDICQTIAYAHSRLVIHRDLKPANIMLGEYGETLVLDWGLAKRLDQNDAESTPTETVSSGEDGVPDRRGGHPQSHSRTVDNNLTQAGQILGTLSYMSPEQAAGEDVGPATDIYALGSILYELLTGRIPYAGKDVADVLSDLQTAPPPAPRALRPGVPLALEAICNKTMARLATDRYKDALALAREVERWLADEPVEAYPDPWPERSRRWMKRHRTLATTGITALLLVTVAIGGVTLLVSQQNVALAGKNDELMAASTREAAARLKAEEHFKLALDAVDKYLKRVGDSPELKAQGLTQLRRGLLESAQEFFARFVAERGDDAGLRVELANAQGNLGYLAREAGSPAAAIEHYQQMRGIYAEFVSERPAGTEHQKRLASACFSLGQSYKAIGQTNAAEEHYRQALRQYEQLVRDNLEVVEYRQALAVTHNHLGNLYQDTKQPEPARQSYSAAERILEALAKALPDAAEIQQQLANTYSDLAILGRSSEESSQAGEYYIKAVSIRERLVQRDPANVDYQRAAAVIYTNLGLAYADGRQWELAAKALQRSIDIHEVLVRRRPWVAEYQADLAGSYSNLAVLQAQTQQRDKARQGFQRNVDIREQLVQQFPDVLDYAADLGGAYVNMGQISHDQPEAALEFYTRAFRTLEPVLAKEARHDRSRQFLSFACFGRASLLGQLGRHADALRDWDRGLELTDPPNRRPMRIQRLDTLARLGWHERVAAEAQELTPHVTLPESHYKLGSAYALASAAAAKDAELPAADRLRLGELYASRALESLGKAHAGGLFKTPEQVVKLTQDEDFAPLRGREDFQRLLKELQM